LDLLNAERSKLSDPSAVGGDLDHRIEEHREVLHRYDEMSSESSTVTIRDQLKKYQSELIELERTGRWISGEGQKSYENLMQTVIPNLNARLRAYHAFNGSKAASIVLSRINTPESLRQYRARLPVFNNLSDRHSSNTWQNAIVSDGMRCPMGREISILTDMMLVLESKVERFKRVVDHDVRSEISKLGKSTDPNWVGVLAEASPFLVNPLLSMLAEENMPAQANIVRACTISLDDVLQPLAYAVGHVEDMKIKNVNTPIFVYVKEYLIPFLTSYGATMSAAAAPPPGDVEGATFPWRSFVMQDPYLNLLDPKISNSSFSQFYTVGDDDVPPVESVGEEEGAAMTDDDDISNVLTSEDIEDAYGKTEYDIFISSHERETITETPPYLTTHWVLSGSNMVADCSREGVVPTNFDGRLRDMMATFRRSHVVSTVFLRQPVDMWVTLGRMMAIKKKGGAFDPGYFGTLTNVYVATCVPLSRILHEYRRLSCGYDRIPHAVPGVTALCVYTRDALKDGYKILFPTFPFIEITNFTNRCNFMMRQFPLRYTLARDESPIRCVEKCVTTSTMVLPDTTLPFEDAQTYLPVWFNGDAGDALKPMHPMPPDGMVVPLWSPMPDAMNAREPEYSVPSEFVLPSALFTIARRIVPVISSISSISSTYGKSFRTRWSQHMYDNRVFLVPGGKPALNSCGYRMGRFISNCEFQNDLSYAWQAESGNFIGAAGGGLVFVPRQHVAMVFSHCANAQSRCQFNNRSSGIGGRPSPLVSSMLQGFSGVLCARFCIPSACRTSAVENGPWHCGIFGSFDGTLRSFLEGPDIEMCDATDDGAPNNDRDKFLMFACNNASPNFSRFRMLSSMPAIEYWSRLVTFMHVMDGVLGCISNVVRENVGSMPAVCPENFAYDTNGLSLSNIANSLYLRAAYNVPHQSAIAYSRTSRYDIHLMRRFNRRFAYNYRMLGIGSSCGRMYVEDAAMRGDSASRFMLSDLPRIMEEFPRRHASDRFVPTLFVNAVATLMNGATTDAQRVAISKNLDAMCRTIVFSQAIVLARYVFFRMGLCRPDLYIQTANLQSDHRSTFVDYIRQQCAKNHVDPTVDCGLAGYAYDSHDMGLVSAHRMDSMPLGAGSFGIQGYLEYSGLPTNGILNPLKTLTKIMSDRLPLEISRATILDAINSKDGGFAIGNTEIAFDTMRKSVSDLVENVNARLPLDGSKGKDFFVISPQDSSTNQLDISPLK
jgi:hypothetical protein